jgi:Fic family protein
MLKQRRAIDITRWLAWFLECLDRAFDGAENVLADVNKKARFWEKRWSTFNERQRNMLNLLLDEFEGKLTSSK